MTMMRTTISQQTNEQTTTMKKTTSLSIQLLAAAILAAFATQASAAPLLSVDFGQPGEPASPVASGFTRVSSNNTIIGDYTVSWGGNVDPNPFDGENGTPLLRDFLYNNDNSLGPIQLNISGLADHTYNLTVWGIHMNWAETIVAVNPGTGTTGSTLNINNTGSPDYTDSSTDVQATGPFAVSGGTMRLLITGTNGGGQGPRINGFTLDDLGTTTTTTLVRTAGNPSANYSDTLTFTATVTGGSTLGGNVELYVPLVATSNSTTETRCWTPSRCNSLTPPTRPASPPASWHGTASTASPRNTWAKSWAKPSMRPALRSPSLRKSSVPHLYLSRWILDQLALP